MPSVPPNRDPVAYRQYQREYQKRKAKEKKEGLVKLLGGKCWKCATDERLRVDHKNFRLICEPCLYKARHKAKHGTVSKYRYCKCKKCRAAKAAYSKAYMTEYRKNGRDKSRKNYKGPVVQRQVRSPD